MLHFSAPVDAKTVQALLSADLKGAVAMFGQAWFLSMRDFWPACSQHDQFIADIESRAGVHAENPFVQPPSSPVVRSYSVEVAKAKMLEIEGDVTAWLDQIESVCLSAEFAETSWIDMACAAMSEIPRDCWAASEQLVLDGASTDRVRLWDRFKDWCNSHLDRQGLARYQLSTLSRQALSLLTKLTSTSLLPMLTSVLEVLWHVGS